MSNVLGISRPITPYMEEVRHSDENGVFGGERDVVMPKEEPDEDDRARREVEGGQGRIVNP